MIKYITPELEKEIQELYPKEKYPNSARAIVRRKIVSFLERPSENKKFELENLGLTVDWSRTDDVFVHESDNSKNDE